ncbi:MAG: NmrA/HSCARG family protein [Verrucomicrobia bacterium]|nr:NmrA/HSCARG family protein [Verrucomicrobiota bacterium]
MSKKIIAVVGGTGAQGGGIVKELLARGQFSVRVLTRNPNSDKAEALATQGCEIVEGDLNKPETLESAFKDAYGTFLVTNFWDPFTGANEYEQAKAAVKVAKAAGVQHLVWSTLPNSQEISSGKYEVVHFTNKALVDTEVEAADFPYYTFVEAPMYYQNFLTMMAPQPQEDGSKAWTVPMDPSKKCIHNGDISEFGKLVAQVFEQPDKVGKGQHLAMTPGVMSWQEMVDTLNSQGHNIKVNQVPNEVFDSFPFPGAQELREMMNYFEDYTYFGPDADEKIALAKELCPDGFTTFAKWAKENMNP